MKRTTVFLFSAFLALTTQAKADETVRVSIPEAFKERWTPPAPVYTQRLARPEALQKAAERDRGFEQSLPARPTIEELNRSRVLRTALPVGTDSRQLDVNERQQAGQLFREIRQHGGAFNIASAEAIKNFINEHADTPLRLPLLIEQAEIFWRNGDFMRAFASMEAAWQSGKDTTTPQEIQLAEDALAWLLRRSAQMGRKDELAVLIEEAGQRRLGGHASEALLKAKEIQWFLLNQAEQNVFCGFTAANDICVPLGFDPIFPDVHDEEEEREFIENGLSLYELAAHSHEGGGNLIVVQRTDGAPIPVPSVIHWSFTHYSAIIEAKEGSYRVRDVQLGFDAWVDESTLLRQASGYFLIPDPGSLPSGLTLVPDEKAKTVYGRHCSHGRDNKNRDPSHCHTLKYEGMASYSFRMLNPGLRLTDTPIKYATPYGPDLLFTVNYDHRTSINFTQGDYGNFGPQWTHSYNAFVEIVGSADPTSKAQVVFGTGEFYEYDYDSNEETYTRDYRDQPQLDFVDASQGGPGYALTYGDGTQWVFTEPNSDPANRYLLSAIVDPQGNALTLEYDMYLRLIRLSDALGQDTIIDYTPQPGDAYTSDTARIRKITDPYGREATFLYNTAGRLWKIIDTEDIVSEFVYEDSQNADFITALITPYGTTTFVAGNLPGPNEEPGRYIQATDPLGQTERTEGNDLFWGSNQTPLWFVDTYEIRAPEDVEVDGVMIDFKPPNNYLHFRNTFVWNKEQMRRSPRDPFAADIYNWLAVNSIITGVAASVKKPDRSRTWFNYPDQENASAPGMGSRPSKAVSRAEDENGNPQWRMRQWAYDNPFGNLTLTTDPLGRQWRYSYHANGIDLAAVEVFEDGAFRTITAYSDYLNHQPQTVTHANGAVTTIQYNSVGQPTEVTLDKDTHSETTRYFYDRTFDGQPDPDGYLLRIERTDPANPSQFVTLAEFSYLTDGSGDLVHPGVRTATDAEGYTLTYEYDNFDRVTLITHPDATTEQFVYQYLDLAAAKDSNGNWTRWLRDALRRPLLEQAPDGSLTIYAWYADDTLRSLTDPSGNTTHWERDLTGRPLAKINPDGTRTEYAYETHSGRMAALTRPNDIGNGPTVSYRYFIDNNLASATYTDSGTPGETYVYDDPLGRLTARTDGLGTTSYSYKPFTPAADGAGLLHEVDGPWDNDTLRHSYDWQNRLYRREVFHDTATAPNDVLHFVEYAFDSLGRPTTETNDLGTFAFTYNPGNAIAKVDAIAYPNGITASYGYHPPGSTPDATLLSELHFTAADSTTLSRYAYTYDPLGRIATWEQQQGPPSVRRTHTLGYNRRSELESSTLTDDADVLIEELAWRYDAAGNRRQQSVDDSSTYWHHNTLNQIDQQGGAGPTLVEGTVDEPAIVEIKVNDGDYQRALVTPIPGSTDFLFRRIVHFDEGLNEIFAQATDASNNTTPVKHYEVTLPAVAKTYEHDSNGNLRFERDSADNVLREFQWDAKDRLIKIIEGPTETEFVYDGQDRRVRIIEKVNDVEQSNTTYLWAGGEIIQRRAADAETIQRNYHNFGFSEGSADYFYTFDHLGSVREVVADDGTTITARYEYGLWGEVTKTEGTGAESDFLYTGHFHHTHSGLYLAQYRAYDPNLGRWLSRDPLGFIDGPNLYAYVGNNPVNFIDPWGLCATEPGMFRQGSSLVLDFIPGVGSVKSGVELFSGRDPITGQQVSRSAAAIGLVPFGKYVTRGVGIIKKSPAANNTPKGGTYRLRDAETGEVRRTGRTNDLQRRQGEHGRQSETRDLDFEVDRRTDSYPAQRGREQRIYDAHPEADLNRKRPISPNNPRRDQYLREGDRL